jgi:hypothetical protein
MLLHLRRLDPLLSPATTNTNGPNHLTVPFEHNAYGVTLTSIGLFTPVVGFSNTRGGHTDD